MDEYISRQAAIDEVLAWLKDSMSDKKNGKPLTERLKDLPSAQSEIVRCKDCLYGLRGIPYRCRLAHDTDSENWYCADAGRRTDE